MAKTAASAQTPVAPPSTLPANLDPPKPPLAPAAEREFEALEGQGLENVGVKDVLLPRLTILQSLSPQLNSRKPEYIEGAKVGDICDVGMGEIFEPPLLFLPLHYTKQWLEWAPRASGKGLVAIHDDPAILDKCERDAKKRPFTKEGNLVSETAQFFGLNISAGNRLCFLPMASTQLKRAKKLFLRNGRSPAWTRTLILSPSAAAGLGGSPGRAETRPRV